MEIRITEVALATLEITDTDSHKIFQKFSIIIKDFNFISNRRPWLLNLISHLFHPGIFLVLGHYLFTPGVFWLRFN